MNDWCILTDKLPDSASVGKETMQIDTRTSTVIDCIAKIKSDVPEFVKLKYVCDRFGVPVSESWLAQVIAFIEGPNPTHERTHDGKPPAFDYLQDAELILAAFQQTYALAYAQVVSMHWWQFLALLKGLPSNTRFMEVIGIRTAEINPKDSAEVKAKKRKAKLAVALKDTRTEAEKKRDVQAQLNSLGL